MARSEDDKEKKKKSHKKEKKRKVCVLCTWIRARDDRIRAAASSSLLWVCGCKPTLQEGAGRQQSERASKWPPCVDRSTTDDP